MRWSAFQCVLRASDRTKFVTGIFFERRSCTKPSVITEPSSMVMKTTGSFVRTWSIRNELFDDFASAAEMLMIEGRATRQALSTRTAEKRRQTTSEMYSRVHRKPYAIGKAISPFTKLTYWTNFKRNSSAMGVCIRISRNYKRSIPLVTARL